MGSPELTNLHVEFIKVVRKHRLLAIIVDKSISFANFIVLVYSPLENLSDACMIGEHHTAHLTTQ